MIVKPTTVEEAFASSDDPIEVHLITPMDMFAYACEAEFDRLMATDPEFRKFMTRVANIAALAVTTRG